MDKTTNFTGVPVHSKALGDGIISNIEGKHVTVEFKSGIKTFIFPDAFREEFLSTSNSGLKAYVASFQRNEQRAANEKSPVKQVANKSGIEKHITQILFCNIAWMKYYYGTCDEDIPINGGSYVEKNHDANEALNFQPVVIGEAGDNERALLLGSFETKSTNGITVNQTHIENIAGCKALIKAEYADGILVVWCATSPSGENRIVGWYKNATVCRHYESIPIDYEDGSTLDRTYNIFCDVADAVLLPEIERNHAAWKVPRKNAKHGVRFGFFRANVWYALEPEAKEYIDSLVKNINGYAGENAIISI